MAGTAETSTSWWAYLSVLVAAAVSGFWAYVRPVPRVLCEERHKHLEAKLDSMLRELILVRSDVADLTSLLQTRRDRASAAAKKAFALSLKAKLDAPSEAV